MTILHLDSGRELRGGQWQVLQLLQGLRSHGCRNILLARGGSPLYEQARSADLDVRPLGVLAIARLSRQSDVTHAHDARTHTLAALAARGPLVVSRRVAFPVNRGLLSQWKYNRASRFIAISHAVRAELISAGIDVHRIDVVFDGVPVPPQSGFTPHGPIVALQSADPLKGGQLLRQAAALAGVDICFSSQLPQSLQSARLFVYVSHQEGLGSAALLSMAAAIPVIASNVGGLPEIVRDGQTGLLTANTPHDIAVAIRRLEDDPALAARLGAAGRALVESDFTVETTARATMAVYEKVLAC